MTDTATVEVPTPWVITDKDGDILARFATEQEAHDAFDTGDYDEFGSEVAYISDPTAGSPMVCPEPDCDGELQLTKKTYWTLDTDGDLYKVQADQPDLWHLYCGNDHNLDGLDSLDFFEAHEHEVKAVVQSLLADYKQKHDIP